MEKIFGSDGFRSEFGKQYNTFEAINTFAKSLTFLKLLKKNNFPVLIGRDSRESGKIVENILCSNLTYAGINVCCVGVISSPAISSILRAKKFSLGVMITASHNPAKDNGIKLFSNNGFKLEKKYENEIEKKIIYNIHKKLKYKKNIGKSFSIFEPYKIYLDSLSSIKFSNTLSEKILIDASNGSSSEALKYIFKRKKNIKIINASPNGKNINKNCGALHPQLLLKKVRKYNFDYGIAFDGDGDRAIFVEKEIGEIQTEKLIVFFSLFSKKKYVVSSEICNLSLKKNLSIFKKKLIETQVGDRHVIDKTIKLKTFMGAEPSGHYFFSSPANTMDGLAALFMFFKLLDKYGKSLSKEIYSLSHCKRIKKNYKYSSNNLKKIDRIKKEISHLLDHENEKLIIRKSMWDPLIRVYYDYEKVSKFKIYSKIINKYLN